jgi:dihydrofolate reductase
MLLACVTISLDGYMAGPDISKEVPMGTNGARLHEWILDPAPTDRALISESFAGVGAVVLGRRTFDVGLDQWNDTPYPAPSFVVTHRPRDVLQMKSASFTFLPNLATAVTKARAAAGAADVILMGADLTQQALTAGLIDEFGLQLAPITLGAGTRLFANTGQHTFRCLDVRVTPRVTHLRYQVANGSSH